MEFFIIQENFIRDIRAKSDIPNLPQSADIGQNSDKIEKRNAASPKKINGDVMLANCDDAVIFEIYGLLGAIRKPNSGRMVCKTYIFINNSNPLFYKNWKQNYKISNTALMLLFWVKVLFLQTNADFLQKSDDISKVKRILVPKDIFSKKKCVLT